MTELLNFIMRVKKKNDLRPEIKKGKKKQGKANEDEAENEEDQEGKEKDNQMEI